MENIQLYNKAVFDRFKKFEAKDLSYSVFEDVDFHEYIHTISFFRSDFRGSKFKKISFYKNNFDRSDFLNSVFLNCNFEKVNFGCCQIKNCYFENTNFCNNSYRNTSIHSSTFVNCTFPDETFLVNMQHCKMVNCTFEGCSFEMSTTDSDEFEECIFSNTNLATMHAENHTFINCKFNNVYIGSSYFFGYSMTKCDMQNVYFLYRGEYVDFKMLNSKQFLEKFAKEHRYNDIINLLKYCRKQSDIVFQFNKFIDYYSNRPYGCMLDIVTVLNTLIFSAIHEELQFDVLYILLNQLIDASWTLYSFEEQNEIDSLINKLQNALFLTEHSETYLQEIDKKNYSCLSINFKSDDLQICLVKAEEFISSFSDTSYWKLVEKKQGSWILTFAVPTVVLISILPHIIKNYADVYYDIKSKRALSKKLLDKLNTTELSFKETEKLLANINSASLLIPAGKCINHNLAKDISSISANI